MLETSSTASPARPCPRPFWGVVTDAGFNRLTNVPVTFQVVKGGGVFKNGLPEVTANSDTDGRVSALLTLGPEEGVSNNVVEAHLAGIANSPVAAFTATARVAGDPAQTSVSGIVLDNSNLPVPGVRVQVEETNLSAFTDEKGLFKIAAAPVGTVKLFVDASTASRPGVWANLEFVLVTVPGRDNTVGMPIYLLPIDVPRGLYVDETTGGTLTLPEVPGFSMTIKPNSVTFPNNSRRGVISVTVVHTDKMPMVPSFGQQPRFLITIQPAGAKFDPPAQITFPNVDGLGAGEVTELYSFDHDLGAFVSIGPATVSEDGSVLASNPGVGILKAGWHSGGNPSPAGTPHDCGECYKIVNSQCVLLDNQVTITTPLDNPIPPDTAFATNFSFLSKIRITAQATLSPSGNASTLVWEVSPRLGKVRGEMPPDRRGLSFSFVPDPPRHKYGQGAAQSGANPYRMRWVQT